MRELNNLRGGVKWLCWCPDYADYIAINDGGIRVLDINSGEQHCEIATVLMKAGGVFCWSPYKNTIVAPELTGIR